MYNKLNITENTLNVLSIFTDGFDREYYIREVQRILKLSPRASQLILEDLESKGILESRIRGKIRLFHLKNNFLSRRYLVFVEEYKAIRCMENNLMLKETLNQLSTSIEGIGLVFGSYAKNTYTERSDLDIFIAGSYDSGEAEKISRNLGLEISVKCYPCETFKKAVRNDVLLKEVLKHHIVFKNAEVFVETILHGQDHLV